MYIVDFHEPDARIASVVGGKAVSLAEMLVADLPVAPGFAVSTRAYREFLEHAGIRNLIERALSGITSASADALASAEASIVEHLSAVELPRVIERSIESEYGRLCARLDVGDVAVAVRSSATAEDSAGASFAGEFDTYVDVCGADAVLAHVRRCWESVFASRAMSYALGRGLSPLSIEMAVVVQKMVRARAAGVMFTLSPVTGDRSRIVLEASWGLGLSVVGGEVTPDRYVVDKIGLTVIDRVPGDKRIAYVRGHTRVPIEPERWAELCLRDDEVIQLARQGKLLERKHGKPQDIEFAIDEELPDGHNVILLQCRPETAWSNKERKPVFESAGGVMSWIADSVSGQKRVPASHGNHNHG